jgi:hypothetical protein
VLGIALVVAAAIVGPEIRKRLPDLAERPEYRLAAVKIEITQPPHWVPHDLVEQVVQHAALPAELSLLDDDLTRQVAEAFQFHPWVEEVVSVKKSVPAKIEVQLRYRCPVAMVQMQQGMYPVDGAGILLPPADFRIADTRKYPVILNVRSTPQGPAGTPWGDPVVLGGARLAAELAPYWKKLGVTSISCERSPTGKTADEWYTLISTGGSRIIWGRAPGVDHPGELSVEQKIGRLKKYVADFGNFDQPHGPYEIDIRHWREISRRPLTAFLDDTIRR